MDMSPEMHNDDVGTDRVMVISVDTHASPPLDVLRSYCTKNYLDEFDAFASTFTPGLNKLDPTILFNDDYLADALASLARPLMHYDPDERLKDMDADGIAAEVIFHGALNGQAIPFWTMGGVALELPSDSRASELAIEGFRIYHRWLVDYCAAAPGRRCGLIHLPFWDLEASLEIIREGQEAGLGGINLPALRPGLPGYHNLHWEPLWELAESHALSLNLHGGYAALDMDQLVGENGGPLIGYELLYWTRRALFFLILGGVFDRHPDLKFVLTEQPGAWVLPALAELDEAATGPVFRRPNLKKRPSEYFFSNCYIGASFMSKGDVAAALEHDLGERLMWGADYPHVEGTFPNSVLSLRLALEGVESEKFLRSVVGTNAASVYGFDADVLRPVTDRVGPTLEELRTPVDPAELPTRTSSAGFRVGQGWN